MGDDSRVVEESRRLTIKDIAQKLNVSTATISNAFNRPDQLSEQLRKRILEDCRQLGYDGPNAAARSLRTGRSGIIGVMLTDSLAYSMSDPVASQFLAGVGEVLDKQHCNMLLLQVKDEDSSYKSRQMESMVDGFIIYGIMRSGRQFERLMQQQKRTVTVDFDMDQFTSVNIENYSGARASAEHALKHGHRQVAILGLRLISDYQVALVSHRQLLNSRHSITVRRLDGYLDALSQAGLDPEQVPIWNIPENSHRIAYQVASEILMGPNRPTLLLCMSDRVALAALQVALQLKIKVPEELHIVGFDGIPEGSNLHPSLTTVHQQSELKGQLAAKIFLGQEADRDVVLPTRLVVRESCPAVGCKD
ncbi:LacI family DNA-binding transcriptional regulator [Nitrincola alkalilacustris]|uniref:LacI family DNA-binding transcriptional regulator n=1 Tax=Nitrincola alkalilacustris TaxID=1571224 RepID=UPI00124DC1FB|nr:LacI family DNA-binding transcriptional regulator [Nitrincola alkalilacustris]